MINNIFSYPNGEYSTTLILKGDYVYWKEKIKFHIIAYDIGVWKTIENDLYISNMTLKLKNQKRNGMTWIRKRFN